MSFAWGVKWETLQDIFKMCDSKTWRSLLFLKKVNGYGRKEIHNLTLLDEFLKIYKWVFCITFFYKLLGERSHGEFGNNNALQVVFFIAGEIFLVFNKEIGEILEFSFLCKFN